MRISACHKLAWQLDLSELAAPFIVDEAWNIIWEIPNDRALGPDGFTDRFYKAAWQVINDDVVAVFNALWTHHWSF